MSTWITKLEAGPNGGLRVAVKDAIDVAGVPTTVGCRAIADTADPATTDAACLAGVRMAGAAIVGKANLHELCFGTSGINPMFGTPRNPRWPDRVPGGSSSGSAVAVATDEADVGIGTDTGGSVRIPAACCGIVGLKTTHGRVPLDGVWPLASSLDTVGPLGRDVAAVVDGMALLEPGFTVAGVTAASRVARIATGGVDVDPALSAAVDSALRDAELAVDDVEIPEWRDAASALGIVLLAEAWEADGHLLEVAGGVAEPVRSRLQASSAVTAEQRATAEAFRAKWRARLGDLCTRHGVLTLPTLVARPPRLDSPEPAPRNVLCGPVNLAGFPALALPLPGGASLQLVAAAGEEALLCATAAVVETAVGSASQK